MRAKRPTKVSPWIIWGVDEKSLGAPFYRPSFFARTLGKLIGTIGVLTIYRWLLFFESYQAIIAFKNSSAPSAPILPFAGTREKSCLRWLWCSWGPLRWCRWAFYYATILYLTLAFWQAEMSADFGFSNSDMWLLHCLFWRPSKF